MSVELKVFGGAYFPKDKALKKNPDLKPLAISIKSTTKAVAEAVIYGKLAAEYPERLEDYFKAKIWEDREGLPCPALDIFSSDFFGASVIWIDKPGEPAPAPKEPDNNAGEQAGATPEMKSVKLLDQNSRAACLVLFGTVEEITAAQYGQVVDLTNDDESSFNQNLAIAITKETRALALEPERRVQLLAWVREKASESAQWPDIKKLLTKWIDTPVEKREQATSSHQRTEPGATLGGGNPTDRSPDVDHNLQTLGIEVALAILSHYDDIDIYAIPSRFLIPAKGMSEAATDSYYTTWFKLLRSTPGILDYSRAAIIALIKSTPEVHWLKPIELRERINRELVESNHANPDQKTIDIASNAALRTNPGQNENDETRPLPPGEANPPASVPLSDKAFEADIARAERVRDAASQQPNIENLGGGVFSVDALIALQSSNPANKEEVPELSDRELAIKSAVAFALSGQTNIFNEAEAKEVIDTSGHDAESLSLLIMIDIYAVELTEELNIINDYDVHHLTLSALEEWSDNPETRFDILSRALSEFRKSDDEMKTHLSKTIAPEAVFIPPPNELRTTVAVIESPNALTYQQQLTIAALQGLCANPAHATARDDLPGMADWMAKSIISIQADA